MVGRVCGEDGRVLWVPEHQHKLDARVPVFGHLLLLVGLLQIEGGKVDVVAVWKEEDPPGMSAALEDGAMFAPGELAPVLDLPRVERLVLCVVLERLGHVPLHKGLILVGAGLGISVDLVHLVVGVGCDYGDVGLFVVVLVDEHVAFNLHTSDVRRQTSDARRPCLVQSTVTGAYLIHGYCVLCAVCCVLCAAGGCGSSWAARQATVAAAAAAAIGNELFGDVSR